MNHQNLFIDRDSRFQIPGAVAKLEVMTRAGKRSDKEYQDWVVIICHPHPQHGGTMDNKVITTVARAARDVGLDTVRFNYRGVGESEGRYGEFAGECEDLDAIVSWVRETTNKSKFILAGFSFGSAVVANRCHEISETEHAFLLAPPIERYNYPVEFSVPVSVIQGGADEVVDALGVTRWAETISSPFEYLYIGHCSHFFHGRLVSLRQRLTPLFSAIVES